MTLFSGVHELAGPPRRLILLRHGETTHNAEGVWQGQLDSPLSERGREQARAAAVALSSLGIGRIVSSDLSRALDTARAVAEVVSVPVAATDVRLREIHAGQWQGLTSAQVAARDPELRRAVLDGADLPRGHTGERLTEVTARCRDYAEELVPSMAPGECALVVSHGVALRCLAGVVLDLDSDLVWRVLTGLGNCHWAELVEGARGWRVLTWNQRATTGGVASED